MDKFTSTLLAVFMILLATPTDGAIPSKLTEIVMIDTGLNKEFSGVLNLKPAPCLYKSNCEHGLEMAQSLEDQLERIDGEPVSAVQIPWGSDVEIIKGIKKAIELNPKVISMSLSGQDPVREEYQTLEQASRRGILIVVASGNQGLKESGYPGRYPIDCLVSVSTNHRDRKHSIANAGMVYIPRVGLENGTSYSTARAAAHAMKFFQENPQATCQDAKRWLISNFGPQTLRFK